MAKHYTRGANKMILQMIDRIGFQPSTKGIFKNHEEIFITHHNFIY
jgi:hypothetical protein